jgi:signal transduction histidine kinase
VVNIEDDGVGIPPAVQGRIFEPYFTTKPVGKGTGQGLSIARSLVVERHGGKLSFESTVGKGATFTMRLPIAGQREAAQIGDLISQSGAQIAR